MKPRIPQKLISRTSVRKPRARACGIISIALCLASFPALRFVFSEGARLLPWGTAFCWIIVLVQLGFLAATFCYTLREQTRTMTKKFADPNYSEAEL